EASGHLLVVLEVTEPPAELPGSRFPHQCGGDRVEVIVQLCRADPERAQVVADHRLVAQGRGEITLDPEAAGVRGPEELVRHQSIVDAQPEWEIALRAAHTGERGDAAEQYEARIERV